VYAPTERADTPPLFLLYPYTYSVVERLPCSQTTFVIYITDPKQEGLYSMFFHNCFNYGKTHSADRQVRMSLFSESSAETLVLSSSKTNSRFLKKIIRSDKKKARAFLQIKILKV
jgi:hypothetical protein